MECLSVSELPSEVRDALFNLELGHDQPVAADIVAFYAFNCGVPRALSIASGLPLAALIGAESLAGWRPKSRALPQAVIRYREGSQ